MQAVRKKGILNATNDAAAEGGIIARLLSRHDSFSNYHRLCALSRFFGSLCNVEFKSGARGNVWWYDKDVSVSTVTESQMPWEAILSSRGDKCWVDGHLNSDLSKSSVFEWNGFFLKSCLTSVCPLVDLGSWPHQSQLSNGLAGHGNACCCKSISACSFAGVQSLSFCKSSWDDQTLPQYFTSPRLGEPILH